MTAYTQFAFTLAAYWFLALYLGVALLALGITLGFLTRTRQTQPPLQYDDWKNFDSFNPW